MTKTITHEDYIKSIKELVCAHASKEDATRLDSIKLVYGAGHVQNARGVTIYNRWQHDNTSHGDIVEVCALGEENYTQLAGTTIHELAHVLSGVGTGHNGQWKETCDKLGLRKALAAGMNYNLANFAPWLRFQLAALPLPNDGIPNKGIEGFKIHTLRGCTLGYGTQGGKSRGIGSGSRLRLYTCECKTKVRVASDIFNATCNVCRTTFKREEK